MLKVAWIAERPAAVAGKIQSNISMQKAPERIQAVPDFRGVGRRSLGADISAASEE
jgi:hypothetical protein